MNDEPMSAEKPPYFSAPHLELVYVTTIIFFSLCVSIFFTFSFYYYDSSDYPKEFWIFFKKFEYDSRL